MNRALFTSHCYLSWGFVAPYVMAVVHIAAVARTYFKGYSFEEANISYGGEHLNFPVADSLVVVKFETDLKRFDAGFSKTIYFPQVQDNHAFVLRLFNNKRQLEKCDRIFIRIASMLDFKIQ